MVPVSAPGDELGLFTAKEFRKADHFARLTYVRGFLMGMLATPSGALAGVSSSEGDFRDCVTGFSTGEWTRMVMRNARTNPEQRMRYLTADVLKAICG